ncbi:MAG: type II toxin-antitoxin system RelE/ParE family toxin [Chloroflexi bacterium]|nr:type II toxin-antitoxin system RelE/ParE family toxin [Chloroflexota bacterium]
MSDGWRYVITPRAAKDLERLEPAARRRIFDALDRFVTDPSTGDRRKLQGRQSEWRLRVGDWRVRYWPDVDSRAIVVLRVLPRARAYRD